MDATETAEIYTAGLEKLDTARTNVRRVQAEAAADPNWSILMQALGVNAEWFGAFTAQQQLIRELIPARFRGAAVQ